MGIRLTYDVSRLACASYVPYRARTSKCYFTRQKMCASDLFGPGLQRLCLLILIGFSNCFESVRREGEGGMGVAFK